MTITTAPAPVDLAGTPTARTPQRLAGRPVSAAWALADLGHGLAEEGFGPYEESVSALAREAARADAAPALLAVLCDTSAPEVTRLRAYARVAAQLARA